MQEPRVQWWLASLDRYGNASLVDGAHSDRAGAEEAQRLHRKLITEGFLGQRRWREPEGGFAIARVELWPVASVDEAAVSGQQPKGDPS